MKLTKSVIAYINTLKNCNNIFKNLTDDQILNFCLIEQIRINKYGKGENIINEIFKDYCDKFERLNEGFK
jgi:ADP-ribosylglycohydrolase|tara:strand:- start:94 stop:303 length:210 start_codon:yes stop_codon:yes gene_type:complete